MQERGNLEVKAKRKNSIGQDLRRSNIENEELCSDLSFGSLLLLLSSRSPGAACPERTIMPSCEEKADAGQEEP